MNGAGAVIMGARMDALPVASAPVPPPSCPFRHSLADTATATVTGWQPCTCPGASSERGALAHRPWACPTCLSRHKVRIANTHGHWTWLCRACFTIGREAVYYDPQHIPAAGPEPGAAVSGQWLIASGWAPQAFSFYLTRRN